MYSYTETQKEAVVILYIHKYINNLIKRMLESELERNVSTALMEH